MEIAGTKEGEDSTECNKDGGQRDESDSFGG
jgi:hypothetical protein